MADIETLEVGDKLTHNEKDETRHVTGFIKNFSGDKDTAKLGHKSDDGNLMQASVGPSQADSDDLDDWEVVE